MSGTITGVTVRDIRFPTTLTGDGSDPVHEPDYSCAYCVLEISSGLTGHGISFTCGRGTEVVCKCIEAYKQFLLNIKVEDIFKDFGSFWMSLTQEPQLRWLGPEKGVVHLAVSAICTALWDLWGKMENKPVWKLVSDMDTDTLLSVIPLKYLENDLTKEEARSNNHIVFSKTGHTPFVDIIERKKNTRSARESELRSQGYPAYITIGWIAYPDDKLRQLCQEAKKQGWHKYKMKVGTSIDDDRRRAKIIRDEVGWDVPLMTDCNQKFSVAEAVDWMKQLAEFKPLWIEEPTNPDDILGHAEIRKGLRHTGIGVASGEHFHNRVMFKQHFQLQALDFCQPDACRLGSLNELLAVALLAAKHHVPVCPHAGGVGLCELVQHLSAIDYICISGSQENRMTEWADFLHEHMVNPARVKDGRYVLPQDAGYSCEIKQESLDAYEYPGGKVWQDLFKSGKFAPPGK